MKAKKLLLSRLAGGLSMWLLAGLWHEVIVAQFYAAETHATHEGTIIILFAYLILALIMAYMYPLGYRGGKPAFQGLKFGILIGILWVFPHELALAGAHDSSILYVFKNALWHMVEQGFGGLIVAYIYGKT